MKKKKLQNINIFIGFALIILRKKKRQNIYMYRFCFDNFMKSFICT